MGRYLDLIRNLEPQLNGKDKDAAAIGHGLAVLAERGLIYRHDGSARLAPSPAPQ